MPHNAYNGSEHRIQTPRWLKNNFSSVTVYSCRSCQSEGSDAAADVVKGEGTWGCGLCWKNGIVVCNRWSVKTWTVLLGGGKIANDPNVRTSRKIISIVQHHNVRSLKKKDSLWP